MACTRTSRASLVFPHFRVHAAQGVEYPGAAVLGDLRTLCCRFQILLAHFACEQRVPRRAIQILPLGFSTFYQLDFRARINIYPAVCRI